MKPEKTRLRYSRLGLPDPPAQGANGHPAAFPDAHLWYIGDRRKLQNREHNQRD